MQNYESQFINALANFGMDVTLDMQIPDGKIKRSYINGHKAGSKNGWSIFCGEFGMFGDWKSGVKVSWKATGGISTKKYTNFHKPKAIVEELQMYAKIRANQIWESSQIEDGSHPYLKKKGVKSYGIMKNDEALIVPLYGDTGEIISLQFIYGNGDKRFLKYGRKKGCFYVIGPLVQHKILCIAEGYATAASIHEATGYPVVVAFDAGNLLSVGLELRRMQPKATLVFCADNDAGSDKNIGLINATEAAEKTNGIVVSPIEGEV